MTPDIKLSITIPKPCSADWDRMTPVEQGKFCGLCSLAVVDFTNMSEAEIKEYFTCHYGKKTCGRFKTTQIDQKYKGMESYWNEQVVKINAKVRKNGIRKALLLGVAILAIMTGCRKPNVMKPHMMGEVMGTIMYKEEVVDTLKKAPIPQNSIK